MEKKYRVTYGGWYQRTTLHLSEVYDFLARAETHLNLDKGKLMTMNKALGLTKVTREAGYLEFVKAETESGIEIRYYEDGLYILEIETSNPKEGGKQLEGYYDRIFGPAIAYIFSLGAPTPKILANIKTRHPMVISTEELHPEKYTPDKDVFGETYSRITTSQVTVCKTPEYIFVVSKPKIKVAMEEMVEMQIFFREFKDQLEKYLDIHRTVWEEISEIKERRNIKGNEVEQIRTRLDSYQKTINLINSRINQMGAYIGTRAKIAKSLSIEDQLTTLFQYKFEILSDTHSYIREIWKMTSDYLATAIQVVADIRSQTTNNSIQSLRLITTYGVVGGIIGYLSKDSLPTVTTNGLLYFGLLIFGTWAVNQAVAFAYRRRKYKLAFSETKAI